VADVLFCKFSNLLSGIFLTFHRLWIYGGAFVNGKSSSPLYEGGYLASTQDVVVVSINYRVASEFIPLSFNIGIT